MGLVGIAMVAERDDVGARFFSGAGRSVMNGGHGNDAMDPSPIKGLLDPGAVLNGTYKIVRRLFEGGMGDIYEASHVRLGGRYAVKVLRRELTAAHTSAFERFRREAEVTSSLRHPHIVQVVDFNQTETGAAYFVMELLEGQNLAEHIARQGAFSPADTAIIVEQVAAALAAAHAKRIVHRDLKPENIHLVALPGRKEPFVKVLDFGISKVLAPTTLTQEAILVGTPAYMAPEQARGQSDDLDGRTDEFALAAITWEMLSGQSCFGSTQSVPVPDQALKVLRHIPAKIEHIPDAVDQVLQKGLAKEASDRYPTVGEFVRAMQEAAQSAEATPQTTPRELIEALENPITDRHAVLSPVPTAVTDTSPPSTKAAMLVRWCSSSSTRRRLFTCRSTNSLVRASASNSISRSTGFSRKLKAPACRPRFFWSTTEITVTGMCRVAGSRFSWSSSAQPSMSGSMMSSVMTSGSYSRARSRASLPNEAMTPFIPFSWLSSRRTEANFASSSMMRTTRSPASMLSRSSSASVMAGIRIADLPASVPVGESTAKAGLGGGTSVGGAAAGAGTNGSASGCVGASSGR